MLRHWQEEHDLEAWDRELARLGGHPLQSALWGEARRLAEGIEYRCFAARNEGAIIALARVETRRVPLLGRAAWIPKGPVCADDRCIATLEEFLRKERYILCAASPWREAVEDEHNLHPSEGPRTIWIDLNLGKEVLWGKLDSQWRYGVGRAQREGVSISQTRERADVEAFFKLCEGISNAKGFSLPASQSLMQSLLDLSVLAAPVEARLFAAKHEGQLIAGAFILRAGVHVHYLWGGVDRQYSRLRAGEAVQWAVMEWAVAQGCDLYDLEGIDPVNNRGTYEFKKKMGGQEIALAGLTIHPLRPRGALLVPFLRRKS